jgi:hypothetical protein
VFIEVTEKIKGKVLVNVNSIEKVMASNDGKAMLRLNGDPKFPNDDSRLLDLEETYEQIRDMLMNPENLECAPEATGDMVG